MSSYAEGALSITRDDKRPKGDFYETPPETVHALLAEEIFEGKVWEPACGTGAIVKVLNDYKISTIASDLYHYDTDIKAEWGVDFLDPENDNSKAPNIITNPPFNFLVEFVLRAEEHIFISGGKAAFLARLAWLESISRKEMFENGYLSKVWIFSRRLPRMHRPGYIGKKSTGMVAYAWFVFDPTHQGSPTIGWLDWKDSVD